MTELLHQPGFLGTSANWAADMTLLASALVAILLTIGVVLAVRGNYGAHRVFQTSAATLNATQPATPPAASPSATIAPLPTPTAGPTAVLLQLLDDGLAHVVEVGVGHPLPCHHVWHRRGCEGGLASESVAIRSIRCGFGGRSGLDLSRIEPDD